MTNKEMIKKYNLDINNSTTFNNYYTIELKEINKELKEGRKIVYNVIEEINNKVIDYEEYYNIIASTNFFKSLGGKESITKGYTVAGYLPTRLISTSPDSATKIERIFTIKSK